MLVENAVYVTSLLSDVAELDDGYATTKNQDQDRRAFEFNIEP